METLNAAVVGAGYWGPNLARNFRSHPAWRLDAVCDLDAGRAAAVAGPQTDVHIETSFERLLARPGLDAVAIATPAATHARLALAALEAGKHVLVEKPIASSVAEGEAMVAAADSAGLVLMVDHTFCYTQAVAYLRTAIADGVVGDLLYVDSSRINLGLISPDVNVVWDLAPHDLAILDHILPEGLTPASVQAVGADPLGTGKACIAHVALPLPGGAMAHIDVNWLAPSKIRRFVIGGTRRMIVWDDMNPVMRVQVHDRGVDVAYQPDDPAAEARLRIAYRSGDILVPALPEREALASMVGEFAAAISEGRPAATDGRAGVRVLRVLAAVDEAMATGRSVPVAEKALR
ncbi:MAG: Gfo/Idh/MocA family protein [Actinomycetes bacterium]